MQLNNHSLTIQIILSLVVTSIFIICIETAFNLVYTANHEKISFLHESNLEADLIADLITAPLAFFDTEGIATHLIRLKGNKEINLAVVYGADKTPITFINNKNTPLPGTLPTLGVFFENDHWLPWRFGKLHITVEITQNSQLLGYLYLEKETDQITTYVLTFLKNVSLFSFGLILLIYLVSRLLGKRILQPILTLTEAAKEVSQNNNYSLRVTHKRNDELSYLYDAFNYLLSNTESLTTHLESRVASRTQELEASIETLKKTQMQLVQSEKMASLGNLVSGVAHEVNTPLGNAMTGGSIIVNESKTLLKQMEEGTLKRSTMEEGLHVLNETAVLLLKSITQAADLIRSFKRISVDQSVEEKRDFNLYHYIEEILLTFHNKIKKVPAQICIEGDPDLIIKSYPGVYAQIFSNFIQNTLFHGFENPPADPQITIRFHTQGDTLVVIYADNGSGMDEKVKKNAFDPFTTTKRNAGGTGLGLNIVYNLVVQKLFGDISFTSEPSKGVTFTLTLPLEPTTPQTETKV
ncbi:MAG: ATP-binding protein [Sulfuricurvum sp.]|jgi:signal transduction histidine kinase|uniref:sensor histidine kinase n=1 Tax=Sulfuricurvum sp. TaxID=2025608 RepID=UPI0025FBB17E|nr:HAMP domain-containing sensor histidine kinase [Sulfuricurvum sp.]MCK9371974.1 ATP-binding protein [Sulfuricurvum sp.]